MNATQKIYEWMSDLDKETLKQYLNHWRMPHSLFNLSCRYYPGDRKDLLQVSWFQIFKRKKDFQRLYDYHLLQELRLYNEDHPDYYQAL